MKKKTLNCKYKPYHLNDLFLQENIRNVLDTLISIDDINILVKGQTNSGKTTLLNCIIRDYYNLSWDQNIPDNNIMFINSLKEQGVNYYRNEMKTFCQSSSTIYGKKKMVIIDDMDTLNEQSQQVFRNYIDKYKNNVNFICSCNSMEKIIESIQSRLYLFTLQTNTCEDNEKIINKIISSEKINICNKSQNHLIKISNNSIRNIINNLEKMYLLSKQYNSIDYDTCVGICTNISHIFFDKYFEKLSENEINDAIKILYDLYDYGYSVIDLLEFLFQYIKKTNILTESQKYIIIPIICKYITIFNKIHEHNIELALLTNDIYSKIYKIN